MKIKIKIFILCGVALILRYMDG